MKKLITAAVASSFAFLAMGLVNGDEIQLPSGTSLEGYIGTELKPAYDDIGDTTSNRKWLLVGDENAELLVTNYESGVTLPTRPEQFKDDDNYKFLKVDTTGRLYRSIGVNSQTVDSFPTNSIGDGPYLDTLVQFTAADDQFKDDALASGDKIAISYVERDADSVDEGEDPYTNFVIRAGYIVSDYVTSPTNYFATVPAGFNKEDWHRLTVRAVASIAASGTQKAGFIVYLDGVALEYSTDVECGVGFAPAPAVAEYYKADCHAIYPSAVQSGDDRFTLSAVAFNGNGCVDDISFTDQTPGFIGRTVTFDLGTGDAVTTLTVAGVDYDVAGVATTNIENLVESFTIAVTLAENYNIDVITNFEGCTYASTTPTSGIVTLTAASATVKVLTTRDNFDYIDENGDPQTAVTLADALANVRDGETIALKFDYVLADWGESGVLYDIDGKEVTIDLHGNKIVGVVGPDDEDELFYVETGAALTIIDSVGGGEVNYATAYGIFSSEGDLFIGAATGDAGATFNGRLFVVDYEGEVIKGNFDVASNDDSGSFLWEGYLGDGSTSELNQAGTYWVVTPQNTPQPTTYEVTWTLTGGSASATSGETFEENDEIVFTADIGKKLSYLSIDGVEDSSEYGASSYTYTVGTADAVLVVTFTKQVVAVPTALLGIVYDGTLKTGVVEQTGFTLTGNTAINAGTYEATATLAQGYIWSDSSTEAKSINWSIAAKTDATVYVTLSSYDAEYSAQLEFPTVMANVGNEAVFGTTAWDPASIVEPSAAGVTNDYTVTFTVTNGNYTGSTGTATFKVWKAASGGEDWPADPTTVSGQTAAAAFGISGDLANADAGVLATWAKANSVNYSDRTTTILTDAFLLDCANTQEAVDAAKANFKVTAITVVGDTVTITPADAADYGNGKIVIEGAAALTSPMSWHVKTTGDHFFRATLVVKPVTP